MPLQKALHSKQLNIKAERSTAVQIEKKSLIRLGTVKILSHVPSFLRQSWSTQPFLIHMFLCRELTKVPHMATSPGDEETVKYVLKRWQDPETGLDEAWRQEYEIYLSFPNPTNPNKVTVGEWNSVHLLWTFLLSGLWFRFYLLLCNVFHNTDDCNVFISVNSLDSVLFTVREREVNYTADQNDPQVVQPFAAYSPAGHAKVKRPED